MDKKYSRFYFKLSAFRSVCALFLLETLVVLMMGQAMEVIFAYAMKLILDTVMSSTPGQIFTALKYPALFYTFLGFSAVTNGRIKNYLSYKMTTKLSENLSQILFNKLLLQSDVFFQQHLTGTLGARFNEVVVGLPKIFQGILEVCIVPTIVMVFASFAFFQISPTFLILFWTWVCLFLFVEIIFYHILKPSSERLADAHSSTVGYVIDIIKNIMAVRLFTGFAFEKKKINQLLQKLVKSEKAFARRLIVLYTLRPSLFMTYFALSLLLLLKNYVAGICTGGDMFLLIATNAVIVRLFDKNFEKLGELFEDLGSVNRAIDHLLSPPAVIDAQTAQPLRLQGGAIQIRKVDFRHQGSDLIFQNFSLAIEGGQKVGLVGYSGGGKSSLAKLILRISDVEKGQITIDGQDIQQITQDSLHQAVGFIPQEPVLFHRSIYENILYGNRDADRRDVIAAAMQSFAHTFIEELPHGYDTLVGERGVKLSGGQRQRIAFARVFLKNPPILMLDEATSQLDSLTESQIQQSIQSLMAGRTSIVIAHRLSTLISMDRIIVIDGGSVVQDGTHEELKNHQGLYQALWKEQVGGFLPNYQR